MKISLCYVESPVVNISKSSTNKAFQTLKDSSDLDSSLDYFHKLFTPPFIILRPDSILQRSCTRCSQLWNHLMNDPTSLVLLRSLFSSRSLYDLAKALAQLFSALGVVVGCIPEIVRDQLLRNFHSKDFINFDFRNELEISKTEIIFNKVKRIYRPLVNIVMSPQVVDD
nr:hypothetical protein [Tanacetum cinerariifolium]